MAAEAVTRRQEVGVITPSGLRFRVVIDAGCMVTVRRVGALHGHRRIVRTWDFGWLGAAVAHDRAVLTARWAVRVLHDGADIEHIRLPVALLRDGDEG